MELKIKIPKNINENFFYIAFLLYFIPKYLQYTTIPFYSVISELLYLCKLVSYTIFTFLCLNKIVTNKFKLKTLIFTVILLFCIVFQIFRNKSNGMFVILIISYTFGQKNVKNYLKFSFYLELFLFLFVVLLAISGVIENVTVEIAKFGSVVKRTSFGFNYPGQLQISLMPLVFTYYYLHSNKLSIFKNIFWIFVVSATYYFFSRTIMPYIITLFFIFCINIANYFNIQVNTKHFLSQILMHTATISMISVLIITFLLKRGNIIAQFLDVLANYRFSLNITAITKYGIKLFGTGFQNILDNGGQYLYLDSEYIFTLVSNGALFAIVILFFIKTMIKYAMDTQNICLCVILIVLSINATVNNGIFSLVMNPFCILLVKSIHYEYWILPKNVSGKIDLKQTRKGM